MIKVINDGRRPWAVRLVFSGMAYGLDFKLTHDKEQPLVEFYDARFEHTPYGQFVSRYYAETLLEGYEKGRTAGGICLEGGVPDWNLSGAALGRVLDWVKKTIAERELNPPIDRKWLSQYIGDMQQAQEAGDRMRVAELLFDNDFNDRIIYTP